MPSPLATVGILSIGEMGLGIAKLLVAHNYRVVTNITGRSADTFARAKSGSVEPLANDIDLITASDYIISILPPRDALSTAERIASALSSAPARPHPLYVIDLNAISPRSARHLATLFPPSSRAIFLDGAVIGGPPRKKEDSSYVGNISSAPNSTHAWSRPSLPLSGPRALSDAPVSGADLAEVLNTRHVSDAYGSASGLKMCFATTTKGFTALAIQAFTTANALGVLGELRREMGDYVPAALDMAEKGVVGMPPKAYRWVAEMEEIQKTHEEEGGFGAGMDVFGGVAGVYKCVAEETVLGGEKTERRKRGRTVQDIADAMGEGLGGREKKRKDDV